MDSLTIEELKVIISGEIEPFRKELKNATKATKEETKNITREMSRINSGASKMASGLKKLLTLGGIYAAFKLIQRVIGGMLGLASSFQETEGLARVAFGNMKDDIDKFAKTALESYGMTEQAFKAQAGTYMAMSDGMNIAKKDAEIMSVKVTQLSADLASMYNTSQEMAGDALSSIWTGQVQSLKKYGVVMTQANINQWLLNQGINRNIDSMSQQEQVIVRYAYVMDALSLAQGNFRREADGWAAQTKMLSSNFQALFTILGQGLMQVVLPVIRGINYLMQYIIAAAQTAVNAVSSLFGIKGAASDVQSAATGAGDAIGDLGDSLGGIDSKGLENVGKAAKNAAKEAKGALLPFDELNVLTQPQESAGGGVGGGGGSAGGGAGGLSLASFGLDKLEVPEIDSSKAKAAVDEFFTWVSNKFSGTIKILKSIDLTPLKNAFEILWQSTKPWIKDIGDGVAWLSEHIIAPFIKWFIEELAPVALEGIAAHLEAIRPIVEAAASVGADFYEWFLKPINEFMADSFIKAMEFINEKLSQFGVWASEHKTLVEDFVIIVGSFAAAWKLVNIAIGVWNLVGAIATAVTTGFGTAVAFLTSPIGIAVAAIGGIILVIGLLIKHWDTVKEVAANVWQGICDVWDSAASWFNNNVVEPISGFFSGLWEGISETASWAWNGILELFSSGGDIFNGIMGGIGDIFQSAINWLIDGINWVIGEPISFINGILNSISDFNILGGYPFSWIGHDPIPIPSIPYLNVGTNYVAKDGLAMIHEGEAVVPKRYNPALGNNNNDEQIELLREQNALLKELLDKDNNVYLDGDELHSDNEMRSNEWRDRLGYSY